jgi:hypothetical protein
MKPAPPLVPEPEVVAVPAVVSSASADPPRVMEPAPAPEPPARRATRPAAAPAARAAAPAVATPPPSTTPARSQPQPASARLDAVLSQVVSASKTPVPRPPAAASGEPSAPPSGGGGHRAEAEALTSAALNHFLQNNYGKALKAVEKALALEPQNKKARELLKILGALG